jgi:hypothetical protein
MKSKDAGILPASAKKFKVNIQDMKVSSLEVSTPGA